MKTPSKNKHRVTFWISPDKALAVKIHAERLGLTVSEMVARMVRWDLDRAAPTGLHDQADTRELSNLIHLI